MMVGLFPELLAPGGVQRAGRHTAAVLAAYAAQSKKPYGLLSLNDPSGMHQIQVGEHGCLFQGFGRAKGRFLLAALRLTLRRPRLVVVAHPNLAPVAWAMRRLASHLKVLVLTHGIEVWTPLPAMRRWTLGQATLVLAPSTDTTHKLVAVQGLPMEKVHHLPWGLDPDFMSAVSIAHTYHRPSRFPEGKIVLTVGRLAANERYKGIDSLIQALPLLLPSVPNLHLVIVGDGDDRNRLEKLAQGMDLGERVHFLGWLPQETLIACYQHCDVFALPSQGEGFGLVFLEAMALGKPVVGGAHGGTPDLIQDGVTGYLVPYGDVEQLTTALLGLLTNDAQRLGMGRRAQDWVMAYHTFEHFKHHLTRVLDEVIGHHSSL